MKKEQSWYDRKKKKHTARKIIIAAVLLLLIVVAALYYVLSYCISPWEPYEATPEKLAELAPIDEDAAAAIEECAPINEGETWGFYIYLLGSNLESCGLDETSSLTDILISDEASQISAEVTASEKEAVKSFTQEVTEKGCTLPDILYTPTVHLSSSYEEDYSIEEDAAGFASGDINTMMVENFPENATVVIQTGGAKRWENVQINPNKSQRFTLDQDGLDLVYEGPVENMCSQDTLAGFISFCLENYPADHKVLILWDHGSGAAGFGYDELFGSSMSLQDINSALASAVQFNPEAPVFDAIGFDACLMSCIETAHSLYGYGKYMLASEELEPGEGWDFETIFSSLGDNPYMSVEYLSKVVADSFVECALTASADSGYVDALQFTVADINEAESAYAAYTEFCESALKLSLKDTSNLATLCQSAASAVAFGQSDYQVINMIDLGNFMQECSSLLPRESSKVLNAIEKSVIYSRGSSYLKECTGLSVYFPARITDIYGLENMLSVSDTAYESPAVRALYYYKTAGCINDTLTEQIAELGITRVPSLHYDLMDKISTDDVVCDNGSIEMKLTQQQVDLTQDVSLCIVWYDEESGDLIYYGNDSYAYIDEDNTVCAPYSGKWAFLGDYPLPLEIVSKTGEDVTFRTPIEYNGISAWLMSVYSAENDEFSILGIREDNLEPGISGRDMLTPQKGDIISIIYESGNLYSSTSDYVYETLVYNPSKTVIEEKTLADGSYYQYIEVQDIRSDTYDSRIARFDIVNGQICNHALDDTVINYEKN